MTVVRITGALQEALTHFALLGLAGIVGDQTGHTPLVWWSDEATSTAAMDTGELDMEDVARAVHDHASARADASNWVQAKIKHEGRETGLFSPRIKTASSDEQWQVLHEERLRRLDELTRKCLVEDLRMIGALGEPAYWRVDTKYGRPDDGASRWEMKTRQQGQEFVGNRLADLAAVVAVRDLDHVAGGLTGEYAQDEIGEDRLDSRSATGLRPPGPTDNVFAWCALWGIATFPVVHSTQDASWTAGQIKRDRRKGVLQSYGAVPVAVQPTALARLRSIVVSKEFHAVASSGLRADTPSSEVTVDKQLLRERNIAAIMRFPVEVTGSQNAPERRLLAGEPLLTGIEP